uniref:Retrovirus-related Pol polyprotein from transposon TNT 1-94 n=1 Tax=Rhizophora mucronata TaxID=61149 RepID=A0A2P2Q495_RHIMU
MCELMCIYQLLCRIGIGNSTLIKVWYSVIIKLLFTLHQIQFFTRKLNISKLTITSFMKRFNKISFLPIMSQLENN